MKMFKTAFIFLVLFIFMVIHFHFLYKAVEKHQVHDFYFFIYFVIYFLSSIFLLVVFDIFYTMKPVWTLFIGCICGWFVSFCSLLITDIILGEGVIIRWRVLFMMSWVMLIGLCYFPFFIFLMKHFNLMKRKGNY